MSQGKEEGRIKVCVLPREERHKGNVLRGGSCGPDVSQQANERIREASGNLVWKQPALLSLRVRRPTGCTDA